MASFSDILVIGGAGFIGSAFVHYLHDDVDRIYVLDKLTYAGDERNLDGVRSGISFVEGDVRDVDVLDVLYPKVDCVINFAAESHVDRSIESGRRFIQTNVEGSFVAMDALRRHDIEQFVQISTDEVYGSKSDGKFDETARLEPSSPYSASKASSDLVGNALRETYDLPITVVRPTNVYGPRQHPEKLIPKFTLRAIRQQKLPVYGDGSNVRQWLFVTDLCRALKQILERGSSPIYNVSGPDERTNLEVTEAILDAVGVSDDLVTFVEDRPGHDYRYALDDARLRDELGFEPTIGFETGIERTVDWYRSHQDRYE